MESLVCISHLRWEFVWQRPQHMLSRLADHYRVLFVEEPINSTAISTPRLEVLPGNGAKNVTIVRLIQPAADDHWIGHGDPATQRTYEKLLGAYLQAEGYHDPVLWLYTPMALDFANVLPHRLLIFDVMDQLSAFKGAPAKLVEQEKRLLRIADVVFTGGVSLYRAKLPFNAETYLFPSGVDVEHYAPATHRDEFKRPDDMRQISGPVLGYFGVIDERLDLQLLADVAAARPDWNFVLLGPVVKIEPSELPQAPNLHYLGMKKYEQLPAYLAHFDIALIPFARNEATRYLSPTKTLEYMAAHKPVISTPIQDVVELYGCCVRIAHSVAEFLVHAEEALSETEGVDARHARENELLVRNTWDHIASQIKDILAKHYAASGSTHAQPQVNDSQGATDPKDTKDTAERMHAHV